MQGRAWLLAVAFLACAGVLLGRLVQLQLLRGADYAAVVEQERQVVVRAPARRGRILDRNGDALVDNRAVYHLAVVLRDLESAPRPRAATPFLVFDEQRLEGLVADVATWTWRQPATVRETLLAEFAATPLIGIRNLGAAPDTALELLAVETAALVSAPEARGLQASDLIEAGLVSDDPGTALEQEYLRRRGEQPLLLRTTPDDLERLVQQLGHSFDLPLDLLRARLEPFIPLVALQETGPESAGKNTPRTWRLLTSDGRDRAALALADHFGLDLERVQIALGDALAAQRRSEPESLLLYAASSREAELLARLPAGLAPQRLSCTGAPGGPQRLHLLQGPGPAETDGGALAVVAGRCAAQFDAAADEMLRLLHKHGEIRSGRSLERQFRQRPPVFDLAKLSSFCTGLAEHLDRRGVPMTPLGMETALTACRRRLDRGWAGSTRDDPLLLLRDLPPPVAIGLDGLGVEPDGVPPGYETTQARFPGLRVLSETDRSYPHDGHASHLCGWLKRLSSVMDRGTALAWGLDPQGWTGDGRGLEEVYDTWLQGVTGERHLLSVPGGWRELGAGGRTPSAGKDLRITLDLELQGQAEWALANWLDLAQGLEGITLPLADIEAAKSWNHGQAGLVLMDCHTGAVLACASTPGFHLSRLRQDWHDLLDDKKNPGKPLHDYATWPLTSPGSTVKPLVGLAAMLEGVYRPGETIRTPGYMDTWQGKYIIRDHAPYGPGVGHDWDMEEALQRSSNSFFATLAQRVGPDKLADWMRRFGFGERNTVDLRWQQPGILPHPGNFARIQPRESWGKSTTWRMGIGQFEAHCVSPIQLVALPACLANGGTILRPYLAEHVADQAVAERLEIPGPILRCLRRGMERVCEPGGTARWLVLGGDAAGLRVAAKTGTSQWGPIAEARPDNAWLIGYAPADRPRIAFAMLIHAVGTGGGRACSGVAKHVLERYFQKYPAP